MKRLALVIAVLLAGAGSATAEQFYKWKDANGVWRYTLEPPPSGIDGARVTVSGGRQRGAAAGESATTGGADAASADAAAAGETPAPGAGTAQAIAARRTAACETARKRAEVLSKNAAVEWDRDGDGTAERLDAVEQAAELARAQTDIGVYCPRS